MLFRSQIRLLKESLKSQIPLIDGVSHYFLEKKGKMIRPILVLLTAKMVGKGEVTKTAKLSAVSLELLHNASLIHDDVVDEADERRGRASINNLWDNKVAVLMGDYFLAKCLIISNEARSLEINEVLAKLAASLSEGEIEQLSNAKGRILCEEAYYSVIKNKTASLFSACMRIGAVSANADDNTKNTLTEFGEKLGIIFQIRDDIFDYYNDKCIGKPTGNDIREGKVTLPLLYALINGSGTENEKMRATLDKEELLPDDIESLISYAKENGGIDYAHASMRRIAFDAKKLLEGFDDCESKASLITLEIGRASCRERVLRLV